MLSIVPLGGFETLLMGLMLAWTDAGPNLWTIVIRIGARFGTSLRAHERAYAQGLREPRRSATLLDSGKIMGAFASRASAPSKRTLKRSPLASASNLYRRPHC